MSNIKQLKHIPSGAICAYVDGHIYDGHEIVLIDIRGVWKMVGAYDFDENVRNGIIELIEEEGV